MADSLIRKVPPVCFRRISVEKEEHYDTKPVCLQLFSSMKCVAADKREHLLMSEINEG